MPSCWHCVWCLRWRPAARRPSRLPPPRPQWDVQLLVEAGFERVMVDMGVYKRIYAEIDEFFNPTPIFTIAAYKEQEVLA